MSYVSKILNSPADARSGVPGAYAELMEQHRSDMRAIVRSKLRLLQADASPLQDLDRPLDALYEWLSHLTDDAAVPLAALADTSAVIDLSKVQGRFKAGPLANASVAARSPAAF